MFKRIALAIHILLHGQKEEPRQERTYDPLDPLRPIRRRRESDSLEDGEFKLRSAFDDVVADERKFAMDAAIKGGNYVADDSTGSASLKAQTGFYGMPTSLQDWYISQGFIGWQACALIAQHWLVNKACSQSGLDATRHGYEINAVRKKQEGDTGPDADDVDSEIIDRIKEIDEDMNVLTHCANLTKFTNVFGIRVVIFDVDYDDPSAYEKPFNIDGVKKGSYKGMRQVDPYWTAPQLNTEAASDPTNLRFYKPTWWVIGGRKYHWTHLHVAMGPEVADILKPSYYYGGVPLTQRIYERVYAAERTANEAPLLAMSKRTTAIHVDLKKMAANQQSFQDRLGEWVDMRDNYAVKILGLEESMEESDTSLSDFDSVIMNQFQLVASISETPATKLLETSPKGFNATGEFEEKSYHERLETVQSSQYNPLLAHHYELMVKSEGWDFRVEVAWNPVDAKTAEAQAEINDKKSTTGERLINAGVISPDEERKRIIRDKNSGYTGLIDEEGDAEEETLKPGELDNPGSEEKGEAALTQANKPDAALKDEEVPGFPETPTGTQLSSPTQGIASPKDLIDLGNALEKLVGIVTSKHKENVKDKRLTRPSTNASTQAGTIPTIKSVLKGDLSQMSEEDMPHHSWNGYRIMVENPAGSYRSGQGPTGPWSVRMVDDYGYLRGTRGADGDGIDVFMGPHGKDASHVFVINQNDPETGKFDEHKCMIGFNTSDEAKSAYDRAFGPSWKGFGSIHPVLISDFKQWMGEGNTRLPYGKDWRIEGQTANSQEPIPGDVGDDRMADPKGWITINNAKVPMNEGGEIGGSVGSKIKSTSKKNPQPSSISEGARKAGITGSTVNIGGKDVISENGKPKVFYHGGPQSISGGLRAGSFLTEHKGAAEEYADQHWPGKVHEFNVSIKNPASPSDIVKAADKAGVNWDDVPGYFGPESKEMVAFSLITPSQFDDADKVMKELKDAGHDGAAFPNDFSAVSGKPTTSIMVFGPDQTVKASNKG